MSKYFVSGGRDQSWIATSAKTLNGAKAVASKTYQAAYGGRIYVGEQMGSGDAERVEPVAVKDGFAAWRQV